ncbi:MAG: ABC transporter ATP-binding protein [Erysipelotrichaceae bacterium]|jgi:ABC-2 type transport system ATP-binding protein|nr:ABC transporter ATP-binding protein [Erysipelotrichaceae bacterium]
MNSIIEVNDLVKRYGDFTALNHLNLEVQQGEILGLLGPNGSGKTTAINCILALLRYDHGSIKVFDQAMTPASKDAKRRIGYVMQSVGVIDELNVRENIDYFCSLYVSDAKKRKQMVSEAIEFVGLQDFQKRMPKKLSGGLLRRLNIACGIAHKPELIILDEPTVAVDPQSRNNILEGIKELNRLGATVLYTSHYMEEVEQLCDRITIIDGGKKIAEGTKSELIAQTNSSEKIYAEVGDLSEAQLETLRKLPFVAEAVLNHGELCVSCGKGDNNLSALLAAFEKHKIDFGHIRNQLPTLNDLFLEITGKELRDTHA